MAPVELIPNLYVGPGNIYIDIKIDKIISLDCGAKPICRNCKWICLDIRDFDVEPIYRVGKAIKEIVDSINRGEKVYLHCYAGCGRTGTVSIALLIYMGRSRDEASYRFYSLRGCGPEAERQIDFLEVFEEAVKTLGREEALSILIKSRNLEDFIAKVTSLKQE